MKFGKIRRRYIALAVVAVIALVAVVRIIWAEPSFPGPDGPEVLAPWRVTSTFPDGKSIYTVEVTATRASLKAGQDVFGPIEHRLDRIRVLCNGGAIADLTPDFNFAPEFVTVGFLTRDRTPAADGCAKHFQVRLDPLPDLEATYEGAQDPSVFDFYEGGFVLHNIRAFPSLAASRMVHEFNLGAVVKLDVKLAAGRVETIAFDCGETPPAPVRVDSPAPAGAFGLMMTVNSSQGSGPCVRPSRVTIVGALKSESRAFMFDAGQRLTKSGSPSGAFDVTPYKPRAKKFWESWPKWLVPPKLRQDAGEREHADAR